MTKRIAALIKIVANGFNFQAGSFKCVEWISKLLQKMLEGVFLGDFFVLKILVILVLTTSSKSWN
jgi:hypothetical protein